MITPDYNLIAQYYDFMAAVVFGNRMELAKRAHLSRIRDKSKILVVGGGTGKVIEYLADLSGSFRLDYVEPSTAMVHRAKKRGKGSMDVMFYKMPILDFKEDNYDVIITNFFFDQFSERDVKVILSHLKSKLSPEAIFIFSDLISTNNILDKLLDWVMFFIFRLIAGVKTSTYPPYKKLFTALGFSSISSIKVGRNIESITYSLSLQE